MASRKNSNTLTNQTISKLVDLHSVPTPGDSGTLGLPRTTTPNRPTYADTYVTTAHQAPRQQTRPRKKRRSPEEQAAKTIQGKAFIVITWLLLVLNVFAVVQNSGYEQQQLTSSVEIQRANGFPLQISMLALAACTLGLTTWLFWKNKPGKTINVVVIIFIILSVSLAFLTI